MSQHKHTIIPEKLPRKVTKERKGVRPDKAPDPPYDGNELVKLKDDQIRKMIDRISSLHTYNSQFSVENEELKRENLQLRQSVTTMKRKYDEIRTQVKVCPQCDLLQSDRKAQESHNQVLNSENTELRNDIEMMKILVYRLNVQLERKREPTNSNSINNTFSDVPESFNWGTVKANILAPLLNSYEEIVDEKNAIIKDIEGELKSFSNRLEEVLGENERLADELNKRDLNGNKWETERMRLQSQFDVCRKRADLQTKRADILQEKLVEVAQCYEQRIQAQTLDLERLKESSGRIREELAVYKGHPNTVKSNEIVVESLKECKSLFEELKKQHEDEKQRFSEEVKELKVQLTGREEDLKKSQLEVHNLNMVLDKQKECNEALNNKIVLLKDAVERLRRSRDSMKRHLRTGGNFHHQNHHTMNQPPTTIADPAPIQKWQEMLRQKSMQMQSLQMSHAGQIEKLSRKLQYKEGIVKKLLQDQLKGLNLKAK